MTSKQLKKVIVGSLLDSKGFVTKAIPLFLGEALGRRQRGVGALGVAGIVAASTVVGAGIALLLAPSAGSELREKLLKGLKNMRETAANKGKEAASELKAARAEGIGAGTGTGAARLHQEGNSTAWSAS